jgi:ankyrin repeat protein
LNNFGSISVKTRGGLMKPLKFWLFLFGLSYPIYAGSIFLAVSTGDLAYVEEFVKNNDANSIRGWNQETLLTIASYNGHLEIVKALIKAKADIDARNSFNENALMKAVLVEHVEIIKVLLLAKANMNSVNGKGPLQKAVCRGCFLLVQLFLENGADPDGLNYLNKNHLIRASEIGHLAIMLKLLEYRSLINIQDIYGMSPIRYLYRERDKNSDKKILKLSNWLIENQVCITDYFDLKILDRNEDQSFKQRFIAFGSAKDRMKAIIAATDIADGPAGIIKEYLFFPWAF